MYPGTKNSKRIHGQSIWNPCAYRFRKGKKKKGRDLKHVLKSREKGDIGEYNQCQTQLKYLYEQNIPGCEDEFLAYRILYMLFSQNQSDINAMLEEMCDVGMDHHAECVQHALMIRSSLAKGNYHKFFQLYETAPNMGGYLLDQFVGRERVDALIVMCKAWVKI